MDALPSVPADERTYVVHAPGVADLPTPELVENRRRSIAMLPVGAPALNRDEALELLDRGAPAFPRLPASVSLNHHRPPANAPESVIGFRAAGRWSLDHWACSARTMWITPEGVPPPPKPGTGLRDGRNGRREGLNTTGSLASRV
jgi:hypothetical protein